ncbi:Gx transporter family protein, partial [Selenomonas sp.]
MNNTHRLTYLSLLTAISLSLFVLEGLLPVPFLAPGAKLGLANIVTVFALYT